MAVAEYWIFDWLRENHITSLEEAAGFLPKYRVLSTLQERADQAAHRQNAVVPHERGSIVAGMGVDLSGGRMVCPSPSCLREQVDSLLKHVWHYFDVVVVDDVLTPLLSSEWDGSKRELVNEILAQLAPLLYLEEIGATDFVEFRTKARCVEHWEEHAREEGLGAIVDSKDQLIEDLIANASFSRLEKSGEVLYVMEVPDAHVDVTVPAKGRNEQQAQAYLASTVFTEYMVDLTADISAAHEYRLPLGSARAFAGRMLRMSRPPTVADIVFQLELPVLEGVGVQDLLSIRRDQSEYFENFRNALRFAAEERLKAQPDGNAPAIAEDIRTQVIDPELAKLRVQLATAEVTLAKKASVGVFLGALATTCGLLTGTGAVVAVSAGIAATIGTLGPAASRHLDDQRDLKLNDMYFLWNAVGHSHTS